ncbi:short-subunit dehydrogenase [Prauserella shujinwangii]|uniref:Short-subunit dehydrogenase n=1 Tax=Prauserella shujinwangii TaxID=1453103 RepID=A0A2T0LSI8_9PSEU|nr:SDR family oxidoreductase [Prauserella shujinwangii]PRX46639.1 short-subunit dehydrogenase [Prauserella shujinwangii]
MLQDLTDTPLPDLTDLTGHHAVVTGGARGIGRAVAARLAEAGAAVAIADIDAERAHAAAAALRGQGREATAHALDVTSAEQVAELAGLLHRRRGRLDVWVNNAAVFAVSTSTLATTVREWREVLSVNLDGTFHGTAAAARLMREQGGGCIVNIVSTAALRGGAQAAYAAAKSGVVGLTRAFAEELAASGVRVLAVAPGATVTEGAIEAARRHGVADGSSAAGGGVAGRYGRPDDIARVVYAAATGMCGWVTGSVITADGGEWTC